MNNYKNIEELKSELTQLNEEINEKLQRKAEIEAAIQKINSTSVSSSDTKNSNYYSDSYIDEHFKLCEKLQGYEVEKYIGFDEEEIVIPRYYRNRPIISIGVKAFYNFKSVKCVTLNYNLIAIDDEAFNNCASLEKVTLPLSLIYIGERAFKECSSLKSIVLPDNLRYIGKYCFSKTAIKDIVLPGSLKYINDYAFWSTKIEKLDIPYGVEHIGIEAFSWCHKLVEVSLPFTLKVIGDSAFLACENIPKIDIPCSVEEIGEHNFYNIFDARPNKRYSARLVYKPSDTIIACNIGSFAQEYARINGFRIEKSTKTPVSFNVKPQKKYYLYNNQLYNPHDVDYHRVDINSAIKKIPSNVIFYSEKKLIILDILADIEPIENIQPSNTLFIREL